MKHLEKMIETAFGSMSINSTNDHNNTGCKRGIVIYEN